MYLIYSSDAALLIHTEPILLPERTFAIEVHLTYLVMVEVGKPETYLEILEEWHSD
jgi:hypothetical protein